jgi:hypothetical protein
MPTGSVNRERELVVMFSQLFRNTLRMAPIANIATSRRGGMCHCGTPLRGNTDKLTWQS